MRAFLLAVGLSLSAGMAQAQPVTLRFSHFLGPTSFFQTDLVEPWARELEARTGNRVAVEVINGASPLGAVTRQGAQVADGTVDIALGLRGAEDERFWRSAVVELPFAVRDAASGSRAFWQLATTGKLAADYAGYRLLAVSVHNPGLVHTVSKRVVTLADMRGLRLRSPNATVSGVLDYLGARPVVLQFNEVVPALQAGSIDGVVTNWGTAIPGATDWLKLHTDVPFYASAFFIVMNRARYDSLPPDLRGAIDAMSGEALSARFATLWDKWDQPMLQASRGPGQDIIEPDAATRTAWRDGLRPVTEKALDALTARGFAEARPTYARLTAEPQ